MYKNWTWSSFVIQQHAHRFFHLGVHVPFYLHFWGYIQIFGGAMYPLTLHLGIQRKLTAFSPRKVMHHAVFCKYYAELAKTFFFYLTLGQTGSGVLSVPPFFCNIVYSLSNFVFYTELNARLPIYSHDH